jgi:outer membrane protein assembly factor BamB
MDSFSRTLTHTHSEMKSTSVFLNTMKIKHLIRLPTGLGLALVGCVLTAGLAYLPSTQAGGDGPKSTAEAWVMFGGSPSRNMVNPHVKGLPTKWSVDEGDVQNVLWSADLGSKAYGGPVISGGKVFVGTNNQKPRDPKWRDKKGRPIDLGVLMAFEEKGGKFLWQVVYPKLAAGRVNDWPKEGICSTPVIEGDKLYYVSNRCEVVCTDFSGKTHWKLDMIGKLGVFPHNIAACSPLLIGDTLFVVTANGVDEGHINVPAPQAPSFISVNKNTGKVGWKNNDPTKMLLQVPKGDDQEEFFKRLVNRGELIQHGQWSNPAYAVVKGQPQVVFPGGDGWIYSFEPDTGKLIWKFDSNPKDAVYELQGKGTRNDFIATPVIYDNKVYIGVGQDPEHEIGVGHLWCIDMTKKGDVSPELVTDAGVYPPKTKPNPNSAMVWHYGGPLKGGGKEKAGTGSRRNYDFGRTMSTCAIQDDILYVAELTGYLHCLDAKTGKKLWEYNTRSAIWSSPYVVDGKVYLGTDAGTVFVFAHGKEQKLLAENDMGGSVRATPAAANGTLFVMTEYKLYAIANKK